MKVCAGRHHIYDAAGVCTKCSAKKKGPGRPPGKRAVGETVAGRLAASLGVVPSVVKQPGEVAAEEQAAAVAAGGAPAPVDVTKIGSLPSDVAALEEKKEPRAKVIPKWTKPAGKRLTKAFVALTDWCIELADREANEPDDEDVDDFSEAMGDQLGIWFPNAELTPVKQLMLSGACIVGGMCIGSKKKAKPAGLTLVKGSADVADGDQSAPGAPTASPANPPQA